MQGFQKQSFVLATHNCFNNVGVNRMDIVELSFPLVPGVFGPPRFPIPSAFPDIRERTGPTGHFVLNAF